MKFHKEKIEYILDQAIEEMKNGKEISAILSEYPQNIRSELSVMLSAVAEIKILRTKFIPTPLQRKLYLNAQRKESFAEKVLQFFSSAKVFVPALVTVFVLVLTGTAYAAQQSLPGQPLFTVRKAMETAQIHLARNPQSKTQLELEFANARLQDAQKVIAESPDNSAAHQIAISELREQTDTVLNNIKQNPPSANDPALVKKLEALTKQQETLLSQKDSSDQKTLVEDIKKIVAVSSETSGTSLPATAIDVTGQLSFISYKNSSIQIDKNTYQIDSSTVIKNKDGDALKIEELGIGDTVHVIGKVKDSKDVSDTITLVARAAKTQDKPESTDTTKASSGADASTNNTNTNQPVKPQDTFGNVIIETPPSVSSF